MAQLIRVLWVPIYTYIIYIYIHILFLLKCSDTRLQVNCNLILFPGSSSYPLCPKSYLIYIRYIYIYIYIISISPKKKPTEMMTIALRNSTAEVTNVLSAAECAAFEDLWHDDLLRLLDGSKVDAEAKFS